MHCHVEERCGLFWPHQIENELSRAPHFTIATKQSLSLNLSRCKRLSTLSALNQHMPYTHFTFFQPRVDVCLQHDKVFQ